MASKKKKTNNKKNDIQKIEKQKRRELRKNKIDKVNYITIILLMILLPLWQIVRIQIAWNNQYEWYQRLHCGYILWIAGVIFLITYIINLVKKRTKIDKTDIILYVFSIITLISTLLADNKNLAIFGITDRYEGILSLISYALLILTVKNLPLKNRYLTMINLFMGLGVVQSGISIMQCFINSDYISKFPYKFMANALCGNPNFLGSYMMILSILAMGFYIFSEKYNKLYFWLSLLFTFTLILAQSTAPLLGLCFGILFLIIYVLIKHRNKFKKTLLITIVSAIVAVASIYGTVYIYTDVFEMRVYKNYTIKSDVTQFVSKIFGLKEDKSDYLKNVNTVVTKENENKFVTSKEFYTGRTFIWNITKDIVKDHVWFGVGPENFNAEFSKYSPKYRDRAHNIFLHCLATLGIFGLISYVALFANTIIKGIKSKNLLTITCLAAVIAYLVNGFFSVNVIEVVPYFYIIVAIILATHDKEEKIYD